MRDIRVDRAVEKGSPPARRARFHNLLDSMGVGAAVLSDPKNVYYLSGYLDPGVTVVPTYLILFKNREDVLVTGASNVKAAEQAFRGGDVVTFRNYDLRSRMVAKAELTSGFVGMVFEKYHHADTIGVETWNLPKAVLDSVSKASPGSRFVDLSKQLETMRMVKDADEVANCKRSCKLVDYAYSVAESLATPGLSEVDLYAGVNHKVIQKAGGFQYFSGDFTAGVRSIDAVPSGAPTDLAMKQGDTLVLDLWTTTKGYWADTCRTFFVGEHPSKEQRDVYRLVQKAMKAGMRKMRPGAVSGDVYRAVKDVFVEAGHGARFPHHAGHGVGLDAWERPYLIPGSKDVIEAGMVLALEPGVYLKGVAGVRLEDNFLVEKDGVVPLSTYPMGW